MGYVQCPVGEFQALNIILSKGTFVALPMNKLPLFMRVFMDLHQLLCWHSSEWRRFRPGRRIGYQWHCCHWKCSLSILSLPPTPSPSIYSPLSILPPVPLDLPFWHRNPNPWQGVLQKCCKCTVLCELNVHLCWDAHNTESFFGKHAEASLTDKSAWKEFSEAFPIENSLWSTIAYQLSVAF